MTSELILAKIKYERLEGQIKSYQRSMKKIEKHIAKLEKHMAEAIATDPNKTDLQDFIQNNIDKAEEQKEALRIEKVEVEKQLETATTKLIQAEAENQYLQSL